jgi:hypothetical protein
MDTLREALHQKRNLLNVFIVETNLNKCCREIWNTQLMPNTFFVLSWFLS